MPKKVSLILEGLEGLEGNAFNLMGRFQQQARKEGWSKAEIAAVLDECQTSDYDHLVVTLMDNCRDPMEEDHINALPESEIARVKTKLQALFAAKGAI